MICNEVVQCNIICKVFGREDFYDDDIEIFMNGCWDIGGYVVDQFFFGCIFFVGDVVYVLFFNCGGYGVYIGIVDV